jgi:hypothetical protein
MMMPQEFVELLETHAEISICDNLAWKRFKLVLRSRGEDPKEMVWLPLTLEPGQKIVRCTAGISADPDPRTVLLGIRCGPKGSTQNLEFETVETLRPERGLFRVETFNAFQSGVSARLARRVVVARIASALKVGGAMSPTHPVTVVRENSWLTTLRLDASGEATRGKFRFFYSLGEAAPAASAAETLPIDPPTPFEALIDLVESGLGTESGVKSPSSVIERQILEPRRLRPRRRGSIRRSP